jgi:hypothetical protein
MTHTARMSVDSRGGCLRGLNPSAQASFCGGRSTLKFSVSARRLAAWCWALACPSYDISVTGFASMSFEPSSFHTTVCSVHNLTHIWNYIPESDHRKVAAVNLCGEYYFPVALQPGAPGSAVTTQPVL